MALQRKKASGYHERLSCRRFIANISFHILIYVIFWIGATSAQETKCGHPAVPLNAEVSLSDGGSLKPSTTATYSCDDGYELFGNPTVTCSANGKWQGEQPFCGTNVAYRKPANQSSTVRGGGAGNGNDGEKTTVHDGKRCTETSKEHNPWWMVDLLRPYPARMVRITTRGCCGHQPLQDIEIRVGNNSDLQRNPLCAWFPGTIEEGVTKSFNCARTLIGQYVFIQMVGVEGSLSLCEIEVFTSEEFSNDRCHAAGQKEDSGSQIVVFDRTCYEFIVGRGDSFDTARTYCRQHGASGFGAKGDLVHGFKGPTSSFLLAELDRLKPTLKTQLVWIGAQKDPGLIARSWKWVDGEEVDRPNWGKDQPNNYNGEQNCVVLDGGRGWQWNDVGCNLNYLHWICQYSPPSCGSPDKGENTTIVGANFNVGSNITYKCPTGYMLLGGSFRQCGPTGFWSGAAPSCKFVDCGPLNAPENGYISLDDARTSHGAVATFSCDKNYTLIGKEKRTCGDDGKWSGEQPQCLFDWCPPPPQVSGATVETNGKRAGSIATYSCMPGFILTGHAVLTCDLGGEWTGKVPSCKFVDCGSPPLISNGHHRLLNGTAPGTTTAGSMVEYSCDEDYWLSEGDRIQMCNRDGKWSGKTPSCELIVCDEPEVRSGGIVVGYDLNVHSTIEYRCEPGHILRGNALRVCTREGEWSGETPDCEYVDCGKVPPILYGTVTYMNDTTHLGSKITYSCSRNYRLAAVTAGGNRGDEVDSTRTCQVNRQWSGVSPKCEEVRCPEPTLPKHAFFSVTSNDRTYARTLIRTAETANSASIQTYRIGSIVKFRCERGYKIVGDALGTCEHSGKWSVETPQCVYVNCGLPEPIANGNYTLASNASYYGAVALYECLDNFRVDGHARRLCLENGTWSSETPICKEITCGEPDTDSTMAAKVSTYSIGGTATYTCNIGGTLEGNSTRVCLKKGLWSGKKPSCTLVDCLHPGLIDNGRVILLNSTSTYGSMVEYHCVPKYEIMGTYLRRCMENGKWSDAEPTCALSLAGDAESQGLAMTIGICAAVVFLLIIILGLIYIRIRKATPVRNTENIEGAERKEDRNAAVMSYATLSDGYNGTNIYENIHENDDPSPTYDMTYERAYDSPYDESTKPHRTNGNANGHYETVPKANGNATVTINGVAVR
ncbi:sushi, von Willebrand factor type A, EGF and pentraxin domain-containing protein 1 [Ischnura elegans]|uniref:sushi, von Willebrand factor type A, EGF and pentraxin domain-containing protein 1 n=1 Tax=Ischnura elegans TaxID=197161 RepID=UPI001ED87858|nr:sushi, von Willebrand factor type A, EGF and pentraxin domain-containing protein 1 [Ischnura elegans]